MRLFYVSVVVLCFWPANFAAAQLSSAFKDANPISVYSP